MTYLVLPTFTLTFIWLKEISISMSFATGVFVVVVLSILVCFWKEIFSWLSGNWKKKI